MPLIRYLSPPERAIENRRKMRSRRNVSASELSGRSTIGLASRSPVQRTRATTRSGEASQPDCSKPVATRLAVNSSRQVPSSEIRNLVHAWGPFTNAYRRTIRTALASNNTSAVTRIHSGTGRTLTATSAAACMLISTAASMRDVRIGTSMNSVPAIASIMRRHKLESYGQNRKLEIATRCIRRKR
jgi:hypothetical protein